VNGDEAGDMQLTEEQKQQVVRWIADGAKLADVQRRLADEFDVRLTYMETRFLIDDLHVTPKDAPAPAPPSTLAGTAAPPVAGPATGVLPPEAPLGNAGRVSLKVDEITRPGAVVSGQVSFSDGGKALWYMDQMGRLGMQPDQPGYRPPEADVADFQVALDQELAKLGF
jgi:hypothetical protein